MKNDNRVCACCGKSIDCGGNTCTDCFFWAWTIMGRIIWGRA